MAFAAAAVFAALAGIGILRARSWATRVCVLATLLSIPLPLLVFWLPGLFESHSYVIGGRHLDMQSPVLCATLAVVAFNSLSCVYLLELSIFASATFICFVIGAIPALGYLVMVFKSIHDSRALAQYEAPMRQRKKMLQERSGHYEVSDFSENPVYDNSGRIDRIDLSFRLSASVPQDAQVLAKLTGDNDVGYLGFSSPQSDPSIHLDNRPRIITRSIRVTSPSAQERQTTVHKGQGTFFAEIDICDDPAYKGMVTATFTGNRNDGGFQDGYNIYSSALEFFDGSLRTRTYRVSDFGRSAPPNASPGSPTLGLAAFRIRVTAVDPDDPSPRNWQFYAEYPGNYRGSGNYDAQPLINEIHSSGDAMNWTLHTASTTLWLAITQSGGPSYGAYSGTIVINGKTIRFDGVDASRPFQFTP